MSIEYSDRLEREKRRLRRMSHKSWKGRFEAIRSFSLSLQGEVSVKSYFNPLRAPPGPTLVPSLAFANQLHNPPAFFNRLSLIKKRNIKKELARPSVPLSKTSLTVPLGLETASLDQEINPVLLSVSDELFLLIN